jgi:hypothetical protein
MRRQKVTTVVDRRQDRLGGRGGDNFSLTSVFP